MKLICVRDHENFNAVIHQLNICMRGQKKLKDSSWNETIDKDRNTSHYL